MNTNSTMAKVQATKMNSREILASKLKNIVATNKQSVEQIDENSWRFKGIEVDSKVNDYIVKLVAKTGKSGKTFKKRELYRVVDGAEQKVELGEYKKEYLYKIVHGLTNTKAPRVHLSRDHKADLYVMRDYIKAHKADFTLDGNTLTGKVPQGDFKLVVGNLKPMKNGHKRVFGSKLYINGELYHEGGEVVFLMSCYNAKKRGKQAKATV